MTNLTIKAHKERHILLHRHLDELLANFIAITGLRPSQVTLMDFLSWSHQQTINPSARKD